MTTPTEPCAEDLARAYFTALQAKDKAAILALLSEDFLLEAPMNSSGPNGLPTSWAGLQAAGAGYEKAFRVIDALKFEDLVLTPSRDGAVVFAEGRGAMRMADGRPYANVYVFRIDVDGGRISRIREYADPGRAAAAFAPR